MLAGLLLSGLAVVVVAALVTGRSNPRRASHSPARGEASPAASVLTDLAEAPPDTAGLLLQQQMPPASQSRFRGVRAIPDRSPFSLPPMPPEGRIDARPPLLRAGGSPYEFYFTRAAYSGYGVQGYASWSVDYPKADRQFLIGLRRLVGDLDAYAYENPVLLTDPDLLQYPFLYAVEVGHMALNQDEVLALRRYLLSGGFLVVDDFWGSREWANLEIEMERVLPGRPIVDIDLDHPVFHCFYDIDKVLQVPNVGLGRAGGPTYEQDGYFPEVRGIFDDDGRLLVAINWNTDMGDAWEWAEDAYYPLKFSTYAYQMGVNYIVYAMTH